MSSFPTLTPALEHIHVDSDEKTDAEIEKQIIQTYRPVRHERNCWTFWHSGFENMPRWCKRNIISWIRRLGPTWDVRCLDMVDGSPNNASRFVDARYLPDCLVNGSMTGKAAAVHASDMIRLPLVYLHGGVWADSGMVLLQNFDDSFWNLLEDPKCPYEAFFFHFPHRPHEGQVLNGFIAARKGNPFIERWMRVFYEIWKDRVDCDGLRYHPLIRHLGLIDVTNGNKLGMTASSGDTARHLIVDYLAQNWCFERVRLLVDVTEGWDGPAYYRKHICFLDARREYWKYAALMPTSLQVKLMSLPFKPELTRESAMEEDPEGYIPGSAELADTPESEIDEPRLQQLARDWLTNIASSCVAVKFSGGYWWPGSGWPMPLAVTWVLPDHEDDDVKPGTWAEWFRYASTHMRQTRKVPVYGTWCPEGVNQSSVPEVLRAETERVLYAGLLEPARESDGWEFIPPFETAL
ncbi:hypothetical protein GGS20DRAFT_368567 [Poronia punctata]|nr:hypothetical protein GGS20DRAFT_368567 [Poronia punctata]